MARVGPQRHRGKKKLLVNCVTNLAGRCEIDFERNASLCLSIDAMISTENIPSDLPIYFTTTQQT